MNGESHRVVLFLTVIVCHRSQGETERGRFHSNGFSCSWNASTFLVSVNKSGRATVTQDSDVVQSHVSLPVHYVNQVLSKYSTIGLCLLNFKDYSYFTIFLEIQPLQTISIVLRHIL